MIDYFQTSVKRLYRINEGEWEEYQDKAIRLELGDKIEAKGIDKFGKETYISSYTAALPEDALGPEAYDGDEDSHVRYVQSGYGKLFVSEEMQGKKMYVTGRFSTNPYVDFAYIRFIGENEEKISEIRIAANGTTTYDKEELAIPEGTVEIRFIIGASHYNFFIEINEVEPSPTPVITETKYYPSLTEFGVVAEYHEISIGYLPHLSQKLYSVDNGTSWKEYTGPFKANVGDIIQAKAVEEDGTEPEVASYTVTALAEALDFNALDGSKETNTTIPRVNTKLLSLKNIDRKTLRIYTTGTVASNAYIKLYNSDNLEVANVILTANLTTVNIPEGSVKAEIYSGSSTLTVTEVNIRGEVNIEKNTPVIEINDANWTLDKTVDITYPEGYRNEYSLDSGESWDEYLSPITVEKPLTVLARVVENGKVISSSSFTITKIDNIEPSISLDIPEKIELGTDYSLPTSYEVGESGGSAICKIGDEEVTSTKDLGLGKYTIECSLVNGAGKRVSITKDIEIMEFKATSFDYTGTEQVFTAEASGQYKLEVWGAQGGGNYTYSSKNCIGGYGAYSIGIITLNANDTLYINIGGAGERGAATNQEYPGGYNGGGNSKYNGDPNSYGGSGGGATHIATESGILSSLESKQSSILIVAGGGGGAGTNVVLDCASGGAGGGISGNDATPHRDFPLQGEYNGLGATQTEGGSCYTSDSSWMPYCYYGTFGQGGSANYGGAGGGFYGGGAFTYSGGGGSGYIGNTLLTDKVMYCYNCEESTEESTKTISTTNVSEEAISNYAKIGNGYAKITYLGE